MKLPTMSANGEAVYVHLYMASDAETMLGGKPLCLHVRDGWMQGRVHIDIESDGAQGDICVRLPGWCADPSWKSTKGSGTVRDGYVVFSGEWKAGDSLDLELPFSAVCLEADWRVREDAGKAAVQYGPFVMCTEEKDNGHYLHMLKITPNSLDARVEKQTIGGIELPVLQVRGKKLAQEESGPVHALEETAGRRYTRHDGSLFCLGQPRRRGNARVAENGVRRAGKLPMTEYR